MPTKKTKSTTKHSIPYLKYSIEAMQDIGDSRRGLSVKRIESWIKEHHPKEDINHHRLFLVLKKAIDSGKLAHPKLHLQSFRLSPLMVKQMKKGGPKKRTRKKKTISKKTVKK
eukprot:TRINITY_DN4468_c0_g1_i1.p1 TRINITY_DN4468_c0_g1~~TRINITY_DN4468_c0_g1_i1.p1  ORF type:complete len:113 (-),score=27.09 TRINITY_DN4468_c0_g1_i1:408-746(-)